jgi:hypothetical protein
MARAQARVLTDHEEIRRWAEERNAEPACVRGTGGKGDIGMLRLDFPGYGGEQSLQHIDWDEWFDKFEERNLALLAQDETARGQKSNFNKLIARETAQARAAGDTKFSRRHPEKSRRARASRTTKTAKSRSATRSTAKRSSRAKSKRAASRRNTKRTAALRAQSSRSRARAKSTRGSVRAKRTQSARGRTPSRRKAA